MSVSRRELLTLLGAACGAAALPVPILGSKGIFGAQRPPLVSDAGWKAFDGALINRSGRCLVQWGSVSKGVTTFPAAFAETVTLQLSEGHVTSRISITGFRASVAGAKWVALGTA